MVTKVMKIVAGMIRRLLREKKKPSKREGERFLHFFLFLLLLFFSSSSSRAVKNTSHDVCLIFLTNTTLSPLFLANAHLII